MSGKTEAQPPFFQNMAAAQETKGKVWLPFSPGCEAQSFAIDQNGLFQFNMPVLNNSIPYLMRMEFSKNGYESAQMDYFVGGFPISDQMHVGSIVLYKKQSQKAEFNLHGRVFESDTNQTLSDDLTMVVYNGYGEYNRTQFTPYERLEFEG